MNASIFVLPGDGVGPEVTRAAVGVLKVVAKEYDHSFSIEEGLVGGCSIDATGSPLTDEALQTAFKADAVLLGAVGGPKWENPSSPVRPEQGLLALRKSLGVYANLRPVKPHPALADISPLKPDRLKGVDFVVVRELTGGLYFGEPRERRKSGGRIEAVDTLVYSEMEIERVVRLAFRLASQRRCKLTSVDKANVLESSRLWRETVNKVRADFPEVGCEHMLVDTAAMQIVSSPGRFDVIVTENMFGDILTDEAAVLAGSMGLLPSASIGDSASGLYEPIHGSAPDIAGKGIANPVGAILSGSMLLRHSLNLVEEADVIQSSVHDAILSGFLTRDIGGTLSTEEMTDSIIHRLRRIRTMASA